MKRFPSRKLHINIRQVLADHGLLALTPGDLVNRQWIASEKFMPNTSHHAVVALVEEPSSGYLFVEKTFGSGEKKIPYDVAKELASDYISDTFLLTNHYKFFDHQIH